MPDADDRHVLAAALAGRCAAIITQNLADFPAEALAPFGIDVQHPDEFLVNYLHVAHGLLCASVRKARAQASPWFFGDLSFASGTFRLSLRLYSVA